MMSDIWYFAYGSNMCKARIEERLKRLPESRRCCLSGYRFAFNKRGKDRGQIYANIVLDPNDRVEGVVYRCTQAEIGLIDHYEGVKDGHYVRQPVDVAVDGAEVLAAETYFAGEQYLCEEGPPDGKYLRLILQGCQDHELSELHTAKIKLAAR